MCPVNGISNNKIKEIKKLHLKKYRDELNLFIIEGEKAVEECISSGIELKEIYSLDSYKNKLKIPAIEINEDTMKKISTTSSACEILAVAQKKQYDVKNFSKLRKIALIDSISDPGNLGTIIRSAAAFGVDGIILYGDCVDLYSSKVIRSAAGNFFKIPILRLNSDLKQVFPEHKIVATALSKSNNISLKECQNIDKYIIMFGSEANGLCKDLISISDYNIKLEMDKSVESLNLSVAASIILYELYKQM